MCIRDSLKTTENIESLLASVTCVWFLTHVITLVCVKVTDLGKCLVAYVSLIMFLTCVNTLVCVC